LVPSIAIVPKRVSLAAAHNTNRSTNTPVNSRLMLGPEPGDGAVIGGPFGRNHLVGDLGLRRLLDSRAGTNSFANATRWPGCEFLSTVTDLITLLDQLKAP
jgi:hypothetical protein